MSRHTSSTAAYQPPGPFRALPSVSLWFRLFPFGSIVFYVVPLCHCWMSDL